jgi:hypothetical protein
LLNVKLGKLPINKALLLPPCVYICFSAANYHRRFCQQKVISNNSEIWLSTLGVVLKLDTQMQSFSVPKAVEYVEIRCPQACLSYKNVVHKLTK